MVPMLGYLGSLENPMVWLIILIVALLLFGRRLPEVGRSLGQGLVEFKKGLKGVTDDIEPIKKDVESVKKDVVSSIAMEDKPKPADKPPA